MVDFQAKKGEVSHRVTNKVRQLRAHRESTRSTEQRTNTAATKVQPPLHFSRARHRAWTDRFRIRHDLQLSNPPGEHLLALPLDPSNLQSGIGRLEENLVAVETEEGFSRVLAGDVCVEKDGFASGAARASNSETMVRSAWEIIHKGEERTAFA